MRKAQKPKIRLSVRLLFTLLILCVITLVSIVSAIASDLVYSFFRFIPMVPKTIYNIILSVILGAAVTAFLSKKILSPITKLSGAMRKVAKGDFSIRLRAQSVITEVEEAYQDFNTMAAELGATEMLQSDFVSNVSHEFKTPINAIEGYATLLQGNPEPSQKRAEYADKIILNTRRLSGLVSNILLLSKIENQSIPARPEPFCLDEQIRQAILSLEAKWTEREIEMEADLENVTYNGNGPLLFHAWVNLIDNAVKFSPRGGGVRICLKASEQNVMVSIADSGRGVSPEDREHIFEKFYQSGESRINGGNGLGLALVYRIVAIHKGHIDVENRPEGGAKFTVVLPVAPRSDAL